MTAVQRARPWLGTLVAMRVEGLDEARAQTAIDAAFAQVAAVHRLMSFRQAGSDVWRINAARPGEIVVIDAHTQAVLACAMRIGDLSGGRFDPTVAMSLVEQGSLPRPPGRAPDAQARLSDVELIGAGRVRLRRPLWIDLGGVAKGYAVDLAVETLRAAGATQVVVDAGGDLRIAGPREEIVGLRGARDAMPERPVALADAALASSAGAATRMRAPGRWRGAHWDGRRRAPVATFSSASVVAPTCMLADALTKVVLAAPPACTHRALIACGAQAATHCARHGWRWYGLAA